MFTLLCLTILLCCDKSFSQVTTTITYDATSLLSTTKCNVFDPPVNVGNLLHTGVIGGATYSNANGLTLPTDYKPSTNVLHRTDYRISYPFKLGYLYSIEITASGNVSNSFDYPSISAGLYSSFDLPNTSTACGAADVSGLPPLGSQFTITTTNTSIAYSPSGATFTSPHYYDYLVLEATCASAVNITASAYIQKIKITEKAKYNVSVLPPYTSCGSTTPIAFTITGQAGASSYNWNLGNANNNWLYNGSPAPQNIISTENSLTLTPVCGKVPNAVGALVTLNGHTYNTLNTGNFSYYQPGLSINGAGNLCSGSTDYFVNSLPCNANVTWSLSPATGVVSPSCLSCNQTTLTRQQAGTVILTANVTNACGQTLSPITKTISTETNTVITGNYKLVENGIWIDYGALDNSGYPKIYHIPSTQVVQYGITLTNTGLTGVS